MKRSSLPAAFRWRGGKELRDDWTLWASTIFDQVRDTFPEMPKV